MILIFSGVSCQCLVPCHIVPVKKLQWLYYCLCFSRHTLRSNFVNVLSLWCLAQIWNVLGSGLKVGSCMYCMYVGIFLSIFQVSCSIQPIDMVDLRYSKIPIWTWSIKRQTLSQLSHSLTLHSPSPVPLWPMLCSSLLFAFRIGFPDIDQVQVWTKLSLIPPVIIPLRCWID